MNAARWVSIAFRCALHAYPPAFRRQYGDEMARVFRQRAGDARLRGPLSLVRFAVAALRDTASTAAGEWRDTIRRGGGDRATVAGARPREESMRQRLSEDMRYAIRTLRHAPGFAAVIVVTLALGIGANTTIFSVVRAVLLEPLPYRDPGNLITIWATDPKSTMGDMHGLGGRRGDPRVPFSLPLFQDLQSRSRSFAELAGFSVSWPMTLTRAGAGQAELVNGSFVTAGLFDILGLAPEAGRDFDAAAHRAGAAPMAIVSRTLWARRFGTASLDGQTVTLDGVPYSVVGIMPRSAELPNTPADVWVPFAQNPFAARREVPIVYTLARLKAGVGMDAASAELSSIAAALSTEFPAVHGGHGLTIVPLHAMVVGEVRTLLLVLFGAVSCLILIACANVANLSLARATARHREIAVRAALGASRRQIVQQLIVESVTLAVVGGAAGVALAWWGTQAFVTLFAARLPRSGEVAIDGGVLLFAALLSVGTGLLFGLTPALHAARVDLNETLKDSTRTGTGSGLRLRALLVVGEVALSLILLCGAGLLARSFWTLSHVDPGFRTDHIVTVNVSPSPVRYATNAQRLAFHGQLIDRVRALSGVQAVGAVNRLPLAGAPNNIVNVTIDGEDAATAAARPVDRRVATPEYFSVMRIPVLSGRAFDERDDNQRPLVAIVNRTAARRFWPHADPLGRQVRIGLSNGVGPWLRIVGMVGDVRHRGLDAEPNAELYVPYAQSPVQSMSVVARTSGDPRALIDRVREQVWAIDREEVMIGPSAMDQVLSQSLEEPRSRTLVFGAFAALALSLAAVGIYGVVAYAVSRMTRDIGVRVALGAGRRDIVRMVVVRGLSPVAAGVAVGLAGALGLSRLLTTLLFGVSPNDPATYAAVSAALLAIAGLAAYVPARRAAKVDPVVTLRTE
jgi:putative ABC transport system permease protein